MTKPRNPVDDLRGASRLAIAAVQGVTGLVETMHRTILAGPAVLGKPLEGAAEALLSPMYRGVQAATGLVGGGIDAALAQVAALAPALSQATRTLRGDGAPATEAAARGEHDAVLAALNGVLGDYLHATGNPLAIEMALRVDGRPLVLAREAIASALPTAGAHLLVLVHGSCMNDRQWRHREHDHGAALADALGLTPVYLHYNSGLHVADNGERFAAVLEQLVAQWPVAPASLTLVGHSMGGLVTRSACHYGELAGHAWRKLLRSIVTLGTPHHGAPLERAGNWVGPLLSVSRYSAPLAQLARIRSAGVTCLRFGEVRRDDDDDDGDRFAQHVDRRRPLPLPEGVACHAVAASLAPAPEPAPRGDGLVPVDSALGRCDRPELTLAFPPAHRALVFGTGHLELLSSATVLDAMRGWLGPRADDRV
ncbi:MAG: alpha/beta hydrolase [Deltaproteobacteria bacterium]|nr:alpha/beta hydrolase [Deltaproteobacteria bacterium]